MSQSDEGLMSVQMSSAGRAIGPKADNMFIVSMIFIDQATGLYWQMTVSNGVPVWQQVTI